ncbi:outer membrane transport energization protein TonB [Arcticibacter tournemirensis]|uniref:Energy transducer TonB n=1 Tax=Arcticibacter tournemirensis TaxID=699437 RepID=A0A5M9H871_9SPHI|nr:energy transducer TonB [Arcticibacter tournemirensis]KAA8483116.1 energy transducer TonB [Arcticibacter tournemirensis]TQM51971.1 outer membrane transport energization protein TonB [Arcticibacter tournemirensis]
MLNDKFDVYRSEWLELVFANRNQEYGAYELRRNYSYTLNKALITASVLFISAVCFPVVYKNLKGADIQSPVSALVPDNDRVILLDMSKIKEATPPAPAPKADVVKIKTTRFVPPRVVRQELVTEEMPEIRELERSTISTKTQDGVELPSDVSPLPASTTGGTGIGVTEGTNSNEPVDFNVVEKFPEYPGGMEAFARFLRKNLRYPASAAENGIAGRVFLSFIVERDGSLTNIKVIKGIGFGCDEEAVRVLKKSPSWSPGIQNKQKVRVQYTLPLLFQFSE